MSRGKLSYAFGALVRRRGKASALIIGLALTVSLVAAVLFMTDALRVEADRARRAIPDVVVQRLVAGRPATVHASDATKLEGIPSVSAVRARVWGYLFVPALQGNVTVIGVPATAPALRLAMGSGRDIAQHAHEMIAGTGLARALGLRVGDGLELPSPHPSPLLTLVGTFDSAVELYAADVVLCDEVDARAILGLANDEATDIALTVVNPDEARVIARTALDRIDGARVVEKELLGRIYALGYGRRAGLVLAASIPALFAMLILAWDRASGLGADEQREIAILKAVGFSTRDVLTTKMLEALMLGTFATALGLLLAYFWVFVLGAPGLRPALVGWSVLYPEAPLVPAVDVAELVAIAVSVLAPFVGLSVIPAWRAAGTDPMESMRG